MVILFPNYPWKFARNCSVKTAEKLLIPVVYSDSCQNPTYRGQDAYSAADLTDVHVRLISPISYLDKMEGYLRNLYFWFLLGPIITLEWLRRKRKLCCVTAAQVDQEFGNEEIVEESRGHHIQLGTSADNEGELQPLICITNDARTNNELIISNNMRGVRITLHVARIFRRVICYLLVGLGYVLLILVALPVGISSGGWSFFRFDGNEGIRQKNFWDVLLSQQNAMEIDVTDTDLERRAPGAQILFFVNAWWPVFQIFGFFVYSRFVCKRTWTVSTNLSKFIRSDWFSSNMYLLGLCVIVPYCSLMSDKINAFWLFIYFTAYNLLYTFCNFLFIIILNKHQVVTIYMFYISVCMICAYVESDIVAVFYFILNSQGALNNLKLTALRTLALGLTLTLSFSSSMHIIRKLVKPQESLFEGLSER